VTAQALSDRPLLSLIRGGRNQPEVIAVERREWDEARIELVVSRAERITFTTAVRHHARLASYALVRDRPSDAEYHLTQLQRLAAHEDARARAWVDDSTDVVEAVAA
jgi:hypothetical protein